MDSAVLCRLSVSPASCDNCAMVVACLHQIAGDMPLGGVQIEVCHCAEARIAGRIAVKDASSSVARAVGELKASMVNRPSLGVC